jgi:hypothetical protein
MDSGYLIVAPMSFVGSCKAQKCADASLEAVWERITAAYRRWYDAELSPESLNRLAVKDKPESENMSDAETVFAN